MLSVVGTQRELNGKVFFVRIKKTTDQQGPAQAGNEENREVFQRTVRKDGILAFRRLNVPSTVT